MALISKGNSRHAINKSIVLQVIIYQWSVLIRLRSPSPFGLLSGVYCRLKFGHNAIKLPNERTNILRVLGVLTAKLDRSCLH